MIGANYIKVIEVAKLFPLISTNKFFEIKLIYSLKKEIKARMMSFCTSLNLFSYMYINRLRGQVY